MNISKLNTIQQTPNLKAVDKKEKTAASFSANPAKPAAYPSAGVLKAYHIGKTSLSFGFKEADVKKAAELPKANMLLKNNLITDKEIDKRRALSRADLSGADLYETDLSGADLSGADLKEAGLFNARLRKSDLSGADLSGADFYGTDLSGADISGADFTGALINHSETDSKMATVFHDAVFDEKTKFPETYVYEDETGDTEERKFTEEAAINIFGMNKAD